MADDVVFEAARIPGPPTTAVIQAIRGRRPSDCDPVTIVLEKPGYSPENGLVVDDLWRPLDMQTRRLSVCTGLLLIALVAAGCSRKPSSETDASASTRSAPNKLAAGAAAAVGHHGKTDCKFVHGWAWDKNDPDAAVQVDVYDGNTLLGTVEASKFRQDLLDSGVGTGKHGFEFSLPASLRDNKPHTIRCRLHGTNTDLLGTPQVITCGPK
jgi:hypothetical protein